MTFNFANLEKYLSLVLVGVHAAATVPGVTNADRKTAVLDTVAAVAESVATTVGDPKVQAIGAIIDVAASVINALTTKAAAPPKA